MSHFKLNFNEANVLFDGNINNHCVYKYFSKSRKVWWCLESNNNIFDYTICQDCYRNNRFGNKSIEIKSKLIPVLVANTACNCDGRTIEESFPIAISCDWKIGIYAVDENLTNFILLNHYCSVLSNGKAVIRIVPNDTKFNYMIMFNLPNIIHQVVFCDIHDSIGTKYETVVKKHNTCINDNQTNYIYINCLDSKKKLIYDEKSDDIVGNFNTIHVRMHYNGIVLTQFYMSFNDLT